MTEGGLVGKDTQESLFGDKIKTFTMQVLHADDEKKSMDGYLEQLSAAMTEFTVCS